MSNHNQSFHINRVIHRWNQAILSINGMYF